MDNFLEKKANQFREFNGVYFMNPLPIETILRNNKILTVFRPLADNISGMAIKIGDGANAQRFILVNSSHSVGRQNFTICHEIYHLFIQENFIHIQDYTESKDKEEIKADKFASYLLLPAAGIQSLIPDEEIAKDKITLKTILKIEHHFASSRTALLIRLLDLKYISKSKYDYFRENIEHGAASYGYSLDLYRPTKSTLVLGDYGILAKELYDEEKISMSHYFALMEDIGINIDELCNE